MKINVINGESHLLINERIKEIVKDSKNITIFDLIETNLEDVFIEAGYYSMFSEEKYIIVKNANFFGTDKIKDRDNELLLKYFEEPNDLTTIIFICTSKLDLRRKITKMVKDKYNLVVIPNLKFYEIENRVNEYLKKEGFQIDANAVKYIINNSVNNYDLVMNEVNKIMLYYEKPGFISSSDVEHLVAKTINTNNFLFVDYVVNQDLENSLKLLNDLKAFKVEFTVLFSLLARDFRIMLQLKNMEQKGLREYEMMNELGLQDWQLEKYLKKIFPYKIKELESIMKLIADLDYDIKSGRKDKYMALELFILSVCK